MLRCHQPTFECPASPSVVGAQDYSLLREGTADVFASDVEAGKKRSASALRLLALAKEEALVRLPSSRSGKLLHSLNTTLLFSVMKVPSSALFVRRVEASPWRAVL